MENRYKKEGTLTGAVLKNIACFTMLTDHVFAILVYNYLALHPVDGAWDPQLAKVYHMGRHVGRVSFVLFAFLLVEGVIHTRSRLRYLLRLLLFALLSEIPFDLAFSGKAVDWSSQNIYWTLFLGALTLMLWEYLEQSGGFLSRIGRAAAPVIGCVAALCFNTDYRVMGILLIFVLYRTRESSLSVRFFSAGFVMLFGTWASNCIRYAGSYTTVYLFRFSLRAMYGLFAFALIPFYGGERGRQLPKPFYYGFYPIHLLVLYGIARAIKVM